MTSPLRIVIADDERPARSFLAAMLRSFDDAVIVGEAASGREAVTLIVREKPDLALLDLHMPELDGLGVIRALKKDEIQLIAFVTAFEEYAVRAFEVNAVDYLLKPVEKTRLREALNRAQERIEHAEIVAEQSNRVGDAIAAYESSSRAPYPRGNRADLWGRPARLRSGPSGESNPTRAPRRGCLFARRRSR